MTRPLLSEDSPDHNLLAIAIRAVEDPAMASVLSDAMEEMGERTPREAMMLCLGVPLDPKSPKGLGPTAASNWRSARRKSIDVAIANEGLYRGSARWARAILAAMLFCDWLPSTSSTPGRSRTRSPWRLIREHHLRVTRSSRSERARMRAEQVRMRNAMLGVKP